MGVTYSNKSLSADRIDCGDTFTVRLDLTAVPDISDNPADIVLILDRSGSMTGAPLAALKLAAGQFIDIIDKASDGSEDGVIGGGSHIGIVSFADNATEDLPLSTSVADLKGAVNALMAGGRTNHADAFAKAAQLFDPASDNARYAVLFTDGKTTVGPDPQPFADALKAMGVLIYAIGLNGSGGIDEQALKDWASDPSSKFVAITPNAEDLAKLFAGIAEDISKPGATDIVITDTVRSCFEIIAVGTPTNGSAVKIDSRSLQWNIDKLGVSGSENASLTFTVRHIGPCSGAVTVDESIDYSDNEDNEVEFPNPVLIVNCDSDNCAEPCPQAHDFEIGGCEDSFEFDAGDLALSSLGRIVQIDVKLRNVCPFRRTALAVLLFELDEQDKEYKRGLKTFTIPAHTASSCRDIAVRCVRFVLPENLDVSGSENSICGRRRLRVRLIAHYIDHDFECCCDDVTII